MSVWFTSDLHLGHPKITEMRGFTSIEEHDATIIENTLFVLGDIAWHHKDLKKLDAINCYKEMLYGNHDKLSAREYLKHFNKLHGFRRYKNFWISHCPVHPQEVHRCMGNIHGHIHANAETKELYKPYFCVNLDFHNFHPVKFETIQDVFKDYHTEDVMKEFKRPEELT